MSKRGFKRKKPDVITCHYCPRIVPDGYATVDHKLAIIKGGDDKKENLVWACHMCNVLKGDMDYEEFKWRRTVPLPAYVKEAEEKAWLTYSGSTAFKKFHASWSKFQAGVALSTPKPLQ